MPWTIEEIQQDWMGDIPLTLSPEEVVQAFETAEQIRGREWVLSTRQNSQGIRHWGFFAIWPVIWFSKRIQTIIELPRIERFLQKIRRDDSSADSELSAMHILRTGNMSRRLEYEPEILLANGVRRPDFRICEGTIPWVYTEVTQLNRSTANQRSASLIHRIAQAVINVDRAFILEVIIDRVLSQVEERDVIEHAHEACVLPAGGYYEINDYAKLFVKSGDSSAVSPISLPDEPIPRMVTAITLEGAAENARQVIVRVAFSDQRAEDVLTAEARQLPPNECGLVMVDVQREPTAFESWSMLIPRRFTPVQHTRVAGVLLFATHCFMTMEGMRWATDMKLLANPHARVPLPIWITELVNNMRVNYRRLIGQPNT